MSPKRTLFTRLGSVLVPHRTGRPARAEAFFRLSVEDSHPCASNHPSDKNPSPGSPGKAQRWGTECCFLLGLAVGFALTGCHSAHVEVTVENRTGGPIRLLEVDYPSASFGADSMTRGATMHYRIQLQGTGPLKVQYTGGNNHQAQIKGPDLQEGQEGNLEIILEPADKAEFHPQLTMR